MTTEQMDATETVTTGGPTPSEAARNGSGGGGGAGAVPTTTATSMTPAMVAALREPFPAEQAGLLPRITCPQCSRERSKVCGEHEKAKCSDCGNYITTRHMHIDYVGHGAVTDRLLDVDPEWAWEPLAWGEDGMPAFGYDDAGNPVELWIRLTVCGVTRLGVGSCPRDQDDAKKVLIGDALRNAAMRFGVALYLWIKGHGDDSESRTDSGAARGKATRSRRSDPAAEAAAEAAAAKVDNPKVDADTVADLRRRVTKVSDDARAKLVDSWTRKGPDETPFLPVADNGTPAIGLLRRNDLAAAEALIAAAEALTDATANVPDVGNMSAEPTPGRAEALAERAASHAHSAADGPGEAGAAHEGPDPAEAPTGGAAPVPEGTVILVAGQPMADMAGETNQDLSRALAHVRGQLPREFTKAVEDSVGGLHHARVNAEILGIFGQTIGELDTEPKSGIDHRRMRVSLARMLVELQRVKDAGNPGPDREPW